ncbi:MAG: DegT/DnrJ/EryC1/StrS family aminotransferase [Chloroflexota bacterium]
MDDFIPVNQPVLDGKEKEYLVRCIETGWISSEGPAVQEFEEKLAARVGRKHGIAVSNGSTALDLAVRALRLPEGSEVIMPSFTIISCAAAIVRAGLKPVLVDAEPRTWNLDVAQLTSKVSSKTRAVMVVHIYGLPTDMDPVLELAARHGLRIIEDAAEMHGQTYRGKACGSFGDASAFSFYPNKHITTGEGGMVVTDDAEIAEICRSLRNLSHSPGRRFVHEELGFNYRLTNLQAALGIAQLERLDETVAKKRQMGRIYNSHFAAMPELEIAPARTDYADNIYWVYGMVVADHMAIDAAQMMTGLAGLKVDTRPFFWGMHEQPVFQKMGWFTNERYPVTERIARRGFYVPSGLGITEEQQLRVVEAVKQALVAV